MFRPLCKNYLVLNIFLDVYLQSVSSKILKAVWESLISQNSNILRSLFWEEQLIVLALSLQAPPFAPPIEKT